MSEIDVYKEWLGIPEGQRPPDYYTLLRLVTFEDDIDRIQTNYRKLNAHVRKYATGQYLKQSQDLLNELARAMLCLTDPEAKREYDESQGREVESPAETTARTTLEFLVASGTLNRSQVSEIEHFAEARGLSHRDAVIQMKLVEPAEAARALAAELRLSFIDLDDMLPEDEVLDQLPRRVVRKFSCLPLFEDRGRLLVACANEPDPQLEDEIRMRFGMPMRAVIAVPRSISQAVAKYYAPGLREDSAAADADDSKQQKSGEKKAARKKAAPRPSAPSRKLTDDQKAERFKLTLIFTCWAIIGTIGICYILNEQQVMLWQIGLGILVGGAMFGILKTTWCR